MDIIASIDFTHLKISFRGLMNYNKIQENIDAFFTKNNIKDDYLIHIGLNEAINNAILHGDSSKEITFSMSLSRKNNLYIRVTDQGNGFDGNGCMEFIQNNIDKDLYHAIADDEHGRGLLLINQIFDKAIYNDKGNDLLLIKKNE